MTDPVVPVPPRYPDTITVVEAGRPDREETYMMVRPNDRAAHALSLNAALLVHGVDAVRVSLVAAFEAEHGEGQPQYDGWCDDAVVMTVRHKLVHPRKGYTWAEKGDVVLAKPKPFRHPGGMEVSTYSVFVPRSGGNHQLTDDDLTVPEGITVPTVGIEDLQ